MTKVGKLFAILNMVLGLLLSFLIVALYAKSSPIMKQNAEAREQLGQAYESARVSFDQAQKAGTKIKSVEAEYNGVIKKKDDELAVLRDQLDKKDKALTEQAKINATQKTQADSLQIEAAK